MDTKIKDLEVVILVEMDKNNAYVKQDGKIVETFNLMAEDYAYTSARKYAGELKWNLEKDGYTNIILR